MSLSLDKLRLLRRQAGDAKAVAPAAPALPVVEAAPQLPVAANDAKQPDTARSVFAWVEKEIRHKPTGVASAPRQAADAMGLRRLLGVRGRGVGSAPAPRTRALDRNLPGTEIEPGLHLIESFLPQEIPPAPLSLAFAKREQQHVAPCDLLFFDTETTGLAGGTGTRAFMIGAADWHLDPRRGPGLRIRQLMISTMAAETAMLRTFTSWLSPTTVFSSYNGRSYDAPLLKTRYRLARQRDPITALDHVDLLYPTRRRYRGVWENCRLATIERQLLKIVREDDLPGSEAPSAWLRYLRGGDAVNLRRVAEHNHQDVVTLAQLFIRLVEQEALADMSPLADCPSWRR
ncbi:hypothetical protein GCM10027214_02180 [Stenotrophomonas tumulicola]|uniref:Ribonuclease H-like domain-containing protein n=1 Tax=Stenotrophomonas tumulicola TaxID=1685415 RepID=A0A7W3FNU6_9GAMM|nr:ribonuclease H-like domain-containing protein [Stenotrophomonas tumulicola]